MFPRRLGKTWFAAALTTALLASSAGCHRDDDGLAASLPHVAPPVVALLEHPEGRDFARWAGDASADRLIALHGDLAGALHAGDPPGPRVRTRLQAALAAVDGELADGCGLPAYADETARLAAMSPDSAAAVVGLYHALGETLDDTTLTRADKVARLDSLQTDLLAAGHVRGAAEGWYDLAYLERSAGDLAAWERYHRRSCTLARRHHLLAQECFAWGQLMMSAMPRGWTAAEKDTLQHLVEQARTARLAGVSTYLISLQAYDAFNNGRYGTARALFETGIAVCRELGDPDRALQTVDLLLRMYALMECWNQVDQLLLRAEQMQADIARGGGTAAPNRGSQVRHASLAARSLAARGHLDEAHAAFRKAYLEAVKLPFSDAEYLGQHWFSAMMEADRPDLAADALATVTTAAVPSEEGPLRLRLPLWRAWLSWRRGDLTTAAADLDSFAALAAGTEPLRLANLNFQADALRARVEAPADPAAAAALLTAGWSRLFRHIHARQASPEAYLDLARNNHLRAAAHDVLGASPEIGYGLELLWRTTFLPRWPVPTDPAAPSLPEAAGALARRARADLAARGAVHCLYLVDRTRVVRWTADADGVQRDVLAASPGRLRALVTANLERLGRDPGDPDAGVPADLAAELAELARAILPPRLFAEGTRPRALFVSGNSFLAQVPFSSLNLDPGGGYLPLVSAMDVAWLRGGPDSARPSASAAPADACSRALVVADPTLPPGTRRRFGLPAGLPGAAAELAAISGRLPRARVLTADRATRSEVTSGWASAGVIYFVGHAVRNAEVPFSTWLPLAAGAAAEPFPGLDLQDVLSAHLDHCRLVVLSGCATGAPYVDGLSTTPSLGDAFLDAGAGAVIQTFWRVRDEGSTFEPQRILAAWQDGSADLPAAVSAERRRALAGPRGVRHPFDWAAWTLKTAWLPQGPRRD